MKFDSNHFKDELIDYIQVEVNNDDFVYGNYVEWDLFRSEHEENLLRYFSVNLPWNEKLTLVEYFNILNQECVIKSDLINKFNLFDLPINSNVTSTIDLYIKFPGYSKDIVDLVFDFYKVPSGVEYEYELPDELRYWNNVYEEDYQDYEYYINHPIIFEDYKKSIIKIKEKINSSEDNFTKKTLLLSSLIVSENFFKSVILEGLPPVEYLTEFHREIVGNSIKSKINGGINKKESLFKKIYNEKAPIQDWISLRNSLAHDIESSSLRNDCIYFNKIDSGLENSMELENLFDKQLKFGKELERIAKRIK